jgi:hypothetical protein
MKALLSAIVLALGIGFALPAGAYWCGHEGRSWCEPPRPALGVYVAPGVGFWWGERWFPHAWHPWGWRARDRHPNWWQYSYARHDWCNWHRC